MNVRQTNMELLRLVSMFLVLVIHANMAYQPWPIDQQISQAAPVHCFFRLLIESLAAVCVNAFVLLSGWFGIRFSFKKLFALIFQVLFFILVLCLLPHHQEAKLLDSILNQYWFIWAYIILFILSPILNLFAEHAPQKVFQHVLIAFFVMQTIFSYIFNSRWFDDGFSPIPFLGLYLLSRYIRLFHPKFSTLKVKFDLWLYLGIAILIASLSIILLRRFDTGGRMFNYTNPLVIISSVSFLLFFSKIKIKENRVINWIAASSIGVYLLHMNPCFFQPYYIHTLQLFSKWGSPLAICVTTLVFMMVIFFAGILLDKISVFIWEGALKLLCKQERTK